jgi:hypothetical protein
VDKGGAAAGTVGGKTAVEAMVGRRARSWNADVPIGPQTGGSHAVSLFPNYPKLVETCKIKMGTLQCCMLLRVSSTTCIKLFYVAINCSRLMGLLVFVLLG